MNNLTIFSVCVGDKYDTRYVYALRDMVANNLTIPHEFKCITPKNLPGINCVKPFLPYQSWWSKMNLYAPRMATGPSIYFDLDVIITGNIDYLADYTDTFSAPANWAMSGHGGIQSSVMAWPGNWYYPCAEIKKDWPGKSTEDGYKIFRGQKIWGDQEYLTMLLGDEWRKIPGIRSYKYHCRNGVPSDARVVVFHGKPDYPEVDTDWIRKASGGWYVKQGS